MSVFVDSSALFAYSDEKDAHHQDAVRIFNALVTRGEKLVTLDWVAMETMLLIRKRMGRSAAISAQTMMADNPALTIHFMDEDLFRQSLSRYRQSPAVSLVDAASFSFMRREGLQRVFAFDQDFAAAGFRLETP